MNYLSYKNLFLFVLCVVLSSCATPQSSRSKYSPPPEPKSYSYIAQYDISLIKVERPAKASSRYGAQKVEILSGDQKYKYYFEDEMVKILWLATSRNIAFKMQNKTNYSIKIPWDEAAYVDDSGSSHRVMHSGVKYNDRDKTQPPSVVVRKGNLEDIIFPTEHVKWNSGSKYSSGSWSEEPLFMDLDFHYQSKYTKDSGKYSTLAEFEQAVKGNVGKQIQVLLPLQIQDVINDYIFTFRVNGVSVTSK